MERNRGFLAVAAALAIALVCVCAGTGAVLYRVLGASGAASLVRSPAPGGIAVALPAAEATAPAPARQSGAVATQAPARPQPAGLQDPTPTPALLAAGNLAILQAEEQVIRDVFDRVGPSVVNISVAGSAGGLSGSGEGSGFVWDKEGHIVTNNHVVEDSRSITVRFSDLTEVPATIAGTDPDSDLAVLKVDVPAGVLQPVEPGSSAGLFVGQRVIAIGNPFGFDRTVTTGIVSGIRRTIAQAGSFSLPNLVQTDAAINPGNSGGPLLDIQGRLVGVNTLIFSETSANSGVGFAIPVDTVKVVVPQLISTGSYQHPYLGISAVSLTPAMAAECGVREGDRGVLVQEVVPGSPAATAGLQAGAAVCQPSGAGLPIRIGGDLIVGVDEIVVESFDDLINYLDTKQVGDTVTLTIARAGRSQSLPVTLAARPATRSQP